jgi:uncharacterized paraquat-inducible protein A
MRARTSTNQTLTCPQCGGTMEVYFVWHDRRAQCQYCRVHIDLPDLDPPAPAVDAPIAQAVAVPDDKLAKISLIVAVVGLTGIFPIVLSVVALYLANKAKQQIAAQPQVYSGEQMTRIATILGWVGIGLYVFFLCLGLLINVFQMIFALIQSSG